MLEGFGNKVFIGVLIALFATGITTFVPLAYYQVQAYKETDKIARANQQQLEILKDVPDKLDKIENAIRGIYKELTTIQGIALVGNFGLDEEYIQINSIGKAARYGSMKFAKVTNLTISSHPSCILPIKGTYVDTQSENIMRVSSKAAINMFESNNSQFQVQIEQME